MSTHPPAAPDEKRRILASCRLYGIVDTGYVKPCDVRAKTEALLEGGVRVVQLRAKDLPPDRVIGHARVMQSLCRAAGALFVLNDYIHLAAELGADALHVGQDAGSLAGVRALVGPGMIVGRSTHSRGQALAAFEEGADYIGFGPLFPTPTKPGRPAIGLAGIGAVHALLPGFPIFCIGGISGATLPLVLRAGALRVVVVSWLLKQPRTADAARGLIAKLT